MVVLAIVGSLRRHGNDFVLSRSQWRVLFPCWITSFRGLLRMRQLLLGVESYKILVVTFLASLA